MGTRIESVAIASPGRVFGGALHLSDHAARECLRLGHRDAGELDLLINAGLYKDGNLAEPALASIIQEDIGANPGHPPARDRHGTFSFDVLDGGCGALTAARLIDGFVASGAAQLAMVVAADADASPRTSHGFPFASAGGAILFAHDDGPTGFVGFASRTFAQDAGLFEAQLHWAPHAGWSGLGRNVLEVREAPEFASRCAAHAIEVASAALARAGLAGGDVDVLIASQYPRSFDREVARGLAIPDDRVPVVRDELAGAHTAGPIAALEAAMTSGQLGRARHVLFVTCGAGITIEVALYRATSSSSGSPAPGGSSPAA